MTREEAIQFIEEHCKKCLALDDDNSCLSTSKCFEAKRMAIEALKAEPVYGECLIIKGTDYLPDGLYHIGDGHIHKYKAMGGTVRWYPIVGERREP